MLKKSDICAAVLIDLSPNVKNTLDLPDANRTTDEQVIALSERAQRDEYVRHYSAGAA